MAGFLVGATVAAIIDWWAVVSKNNKLGYVSKPLVIGLLGIGLAVELDVSLGSQPFWFVAALAFSLIGDVFLMLPNEKFLAGLGVFLLAHISLFLGFKPYPIPGDVTGAAMFLAGIIIVIAIMSGNIFVKRFYRNGGNKDVSRMALPIILYIVFLNIMLFGGVYRFIDPNWNGIAAYLSAFGALLFYYSDFLLGWDRFVKSIEHGKIKIRISYHLGQIGIAAGVWLYFR